eukprot:TRINITY_DN3493_c0_g1_i13.p1 TRINITY_DN3493_c0_g1~~TRINITY_DN3493_c0_g1_i13.p1  ORF type:complete len:397 (+),score=127.10 TRINITY_DN3493_c0_g1_i13:70-1260(+)
MSNENEDQQPQVGEEDLTALMEEIIEKLRLLNYEQQFLANKGLKPLNKAYFAFSTNQIEQFNYFKQLVKWLFQMNEAQSSDYGKYDDPITAASNIQMELKKLGIECDFPPVKLKSGAGEEVCTVILNLLNRALKIKRFQFKPPKFEVSKKGNDEEAFEDREGDENIDMAEAIDNEDDIEEEHFEDNQDKNWQDNAQDANQDKNIIKSNIEEKEWILECERVGPRLKYTIPNETKEWRGHIEQMRTFEDTIKKNIPDARNRLEKLSEEMTKLLDRISQRENSINVNLNDQGLQYRTQAEDYKTLQQGYQTKNEAVNEMREKFKKINEQFESIQAKIDEYGSNATDSSPIVKIKEAIKNLRAEIAAIDLRSGIVNHTCLLYTSPSPRDRQKSRMPSSA